jgi:hypothetical protein
MRLSEISDHHVDLTKAMSETQSPVKDPALPAFIHQGPAQDAHYRNPNLMIVDASKQVDLSGSSPDLVGPRGSSWWTGKPPAETPGFNPDSGTLMSLPSPALDSLTLPRLQDYFDNTWTLTEVLFSSLQGDSTFLRYPYHHLRHPLVFYYAHPAVLYVNKLRVAGLLQCGINPAFESLFETGVDEMSWDDLSRTPVTGHRSPPSPSIAAVCIVLFQALSPDWTT